MESMGKEKEIIKNFASPHRFRIGVFLFMGLILSSTEAVPFGRLQEPQQSSDLGQPGQLTNIRTQLEPIIESLDTGKIGKYADEEGENELDGTEWETVIDPHLYVYTEWKRSPGMQQFRRHKRNTGPSLSIVNPLDVLRQRLLMEIARRRMRQSHHQIMKNDEILKHIGKRR